MPKARTPPAQGPVTNNTKPSILAKKIDRIKYKRITPLLPGYLFPVTVTNDIFQLHLHSFLIMSKVLHPFKLSYEEKTRNHPYTI
jgi:hypothetical protein